MEATRGCIAALEENCFLEALELTETREAGRWKEPDAVSGRIEWDSAWIRTSSN